MKEKMKRKKTEGKKDDTVHNIMTKSRLTKNEDLIEICNLLYFWKSSHGNILIELLHHDLKNSFDTLYFVRSQGSRLLNQEEEEELVQRRGEKRRIMLLNLPLVRSVQ